MFVELIELLRCPNAHEETPLIAAAERTVDRHLVQGTLGCPVCRAEFPITRGIGEFGEGPRVEGERPDAESAMRLAAFLELNEVRRFAILCGRHASQTDQVARLAQTPLVLVNAPDNAGDAAASIRVKDAMPFATGAAHAAALDESVEPALAASIVAVVRSGGRVIGPVSMTPPPGVREIVRDERLWVAERIAAPSPLEPAPRLVTLKRA